MTPIRCRICHDARATHVVAWNTSANGGVQGVQDVCERHASPLANEYRRCGFNASVAVK